MGQDIVLMPAWRRPEFLAIALEHVARAQHAAEHHFVVLADRGCDRAVLRVCETFSAGLSLQVLWRHGEHSYLGNNYNVLEGYRYARHLSRQRGGTLVYLIEEDAWVARDIFAFSRLVHRSLAPFALSASLNLNDAPGGGPIHKPHDKAALYAHPYYQSVCTSLPLASLDLILPHACAAYYGNTHRYVAQHFPASRWGTARSQQDGLIDRVMEARGQQQLYPYVPRAMHAGFVGANRPGHPLLGTLAQRIEQLRQLSIGEMNSRAAAYKDMFALDVAGQHAEAVYLASV